MDAGEAIRAAHHAELMKAAKWERMVRIQMAGGLLVLREEQSEAAAEYWGEQHPKFLEAVAALNAAKAEYASAKEETVEQIVARRSSSTGGLGRTR